MYNTADQEAQIDLLVLTLNTVLEIIQSMT